MNILQLRSFNLSKISFNCFVSFHILVIGLLVRFMLWEIMRVGMNRIRGLFKLGLGIRMCKLNM